MPMSIEAKARIAAHKAKTRGSNPRNLSPRAAEAIVANYIAYASAAYLHGIVQTTAAMRNARNILIGLMAGPGGARLLYHRAGDRPDTQQIKTASLRIRWAWVRRQTSASAATLEAAVRSAASPLIPVGSFLRETYVPGKGITRKTETVYPLAFILHALLASGVDVTDYVACCTDDGVVVEQ